MTAIASRSSSVRDELACEPLLSCRSLLMASLVARAEGLAVELGRCPVTAEGRQPPLRPLHLGLDVLPRVRRLAEAALGQLAGKVVVGDEMTVLAREGELGAAVYCEEGGMPWFSLLHEDGSGVLAMPVRDAGVVAKLFRDAERGLSERGLAPLDRGAAH